MASTLVKNDIHITFHVKTNSPRILPDDLPALFNYISGIIMNRGGIAMATGGMPDHIHLLTSLPKTVSLSDYVRDIKAGSSKWLKTQGTHYARFEWQEGYGAFSVSPSLLDKTVAYIHGQAEHHKKRTFAEEYKAFLEASKIEYNEQYFLSD
jgi:REP element-mobilizing transposase RayT